MLKYIINTIKFLKFVRYNVGFIYLTPDKLMNNQDPSQSLFANKTYWLKNPSIRRWYADPFILSVTDSTINVLVEEYIFNKPGRLVSLLVDRKDWTIIEKNIILEKKTHLSYPQIIIEKDTQYVCPENGQGGSVELYKLTNNNLEHVTKLLEGIYYDATLYHDKASNQWYMLATTSEYELYLFKSQTLTGKWEVVSPKPITIDQRYSRCGGYIFESGSKRYRIAQDCKNTYGNSIHIMQVDSFEPYSEHEVMHLKPFSKKYDSGFHTLNFHTSGLAILDSTTYTVPIIGKFLAKVLNPISDKISKFH